MIKTAREILDDRLDKLGKYKDIDSLMEHDLICHILDCGFYKKIAKFAKRLGYKKVVDIGCAYGNQKVFFDEVGIGYLGIDENIENDYVIKGVYPYVEVKGDNETLAISHLCLTWNIYTGNDDEIIEKQLKGLKRDFKSILLHTQEDKEKLIKKHFKTVLELENEVLAKLLFLINLREESKCGKS